MNEKEFTEIYIEMRNRLRTSSYYHGEIIEWRNTIWNKLTPKQKKELNRLMSESLLWK